MSSELGVIFDMDGVLVDSTRAHFEAFKTFGERHGVPFTWDFFRQIFGLHNRTIFPMWLGPTLSQAQAEAYALEKEALYRALAPTLVRPLPGVIELLDSLHAAGFRLAVGSSGPRANVEVALDIVGRRELFQFTVSGDDAPRGKPDPAIFLQAGQGLGLPPSRCAVIEDAIAGVQAGIAASMKVIAVCSSLKREQLSKAHLIVETLHDVNAEVIRTLINE